MCSWCWAYRPVWLQLRDKLPESVKWQNVLGGLAPDNDQPMPENLRNMIQGHWRHIESSTNTEFNFEFWTKCQPRRDTYKACRAVVAAAKQHAEEAMIEAIQKAYYLRAMNPSDPHSLADLAAELGLERSRFVEDFASAETDTEFRRQLNLRTSMGVTSFPSLVLEHNAMYSRIKHDYQDYHPALAGIQRSLNGVV